MIKADTIQFEDVESTFHKWANIYAKKWHLDKWELISAAWLYGKVRFLPLSKIKFASQRIRFDMVDYLRKVTKHRIQQSLENRIYFNNISDIEFNSPAEDADGFGAFLQSEDEDFETKDLVGFLVNHPSLNRTEKLVMKSIYLSKCTMAEVAKAIGITDSRVSLIHSDIIDRLRSLNHVKLVG
jgi:DNA-directed RNA polymerase specialized sigma subunit